jgi:hypothetical protein
MELVVEDPADRGEQSFDPVEFDFFAQSALNLPVDAERPLRTQPAMRIGRQVLLEEGDAKSLEHRQSKGLAR